MGPHRCGSGGVGGGNPEVGAGRYGERSRPAAIVLTHGHFDHVGAVEELAREWDVPVYAMRRNSRIWTGEPRIRRPIRVSGAASCPCCLPLSARADRSGRPVAPLTFRTARFPPAPGWRWIATPGHSPGHVSLWNEARRTLPGTRSSPRPRNRPTRSPPNDPSSWPPHVLYAGLGQRRESVQRLARLEPELVVTGHGPAMQGPEMTAALHALARDFDTIAVPRQGRYVHDPARFEPCGVTHLPRVETVTPEVSQGGTFPPATNRVHGTCPADRIGRRTLERPPLLVRQPP